MIWITGCIVIGFVLGLLGIPVIPAVIIAIVGSVVWTELCHWNEW